MSKNEIPKTSITKSSNSELNKVNKRKKEKYQRKYFVALRASEEFAEKVLERVKDFESYKTNDFKRKTIEFKDTLKSSKKTQPSSLASSLLLDTFALAYRAIEEVYGISLYKVQIMGAFALNEGDVAEMKTGEGKTLTAILPAYYNSLFGKGVHIITVNEYLASRDAYNTGKVFNLLGVSIGHINAKMKPEEKREQYMKDILYSTNSEIGFDYLRDNLVKQSSDKVQRKFNYAIIDEVDSILIDEARTPLIISGGANFEDTDYEKAQEFVENLKLADYTVDKETRQSFLTDSGVLKSEDFYKTENLYSYKNSRLVHLLVNALQANYVYKFDVDYTTKEDEIILIDSFTGRLLEGRQFSEGLNQAIEAKERVTIKTETKTFASITYQNLFRMYKKLSGMSGTAIAEEEEFLEVYNMRVLQIPTNVDIERRDLVDVIFATRKAKYRAVIKRIYEIHRTGQPILIGTRSVSESEILSNQLTKLNIKHEVLNAKNHGREAEIISRAGELKQITIATNMAGRGTDIKLGFKVIEVGGLFVLGTERNESRRIDNQLRGRSGRQGDIGFSQFYISIDDEIMQRAGLKRIQKYLKSIDENPISSRGVQKSITIAQKKLEGLNYDYRKSIIEYDDILNTQRILTYTQRDIILKLYDYKKMVLTLINSFIRNQLDEKFAFQHGKFNSILFFEKMNNQFHLGYEGKPNLTITETGKIALELLTNKFEEKIIYMENNDLEVLPFIKNVLLMSLDMNWQDQIDKLSKLKSGIRYRQYAQKNPVQIYVQESSLLFELYKKQIVEQGVLIILNAAIRKNPPQPLKAKNTNTKEIQVR